MWLWKALPCFDDVYTTQWLIKGTVSGGMFVTNVRFLFNFQVFYIVSQPAKQMRGAWGKQQSRDTGQETPKKRSYVSW